MADVSPSDTYGHRGFINLKITRREHDVKPTFRVILSYNSKLPNSFTRPQEREREREEGRERESSTPMLRRFLRCSEDFCAMFIYVLQGAAEHKEFNSCFSPGKSVFISDFHPGRIT